MKFTVSILLIALLSLTACLYLPWWSIAVVAFVVAVAIPQLPGRSFLSGFIALFLLWGSMAWLMSSANNHILAQKISMLILKRNNPAMLVAITALIGALVAGLASFTGSFLRKI